MSSKPVLVASDAHLGAVPEEQEKAFLTWLASTPDFASHVILNGDVFDFWFEYRTGITRGYDRVLAVLRDVVQAGLPVTLMGGNHDWWGGRYLREEIGVEFFQDPVVRQYAGLTTFLAHGDGLGKGDLGYRALKLVLRGRMTRFAFGLLPPAVGDNVAGHVSQTEQRWGAPTEDEQSRSLVLEEWAVAKLEAEPELDLVILGHTHVPRVREVAPGRWYVNAGDWVYHATYAVLEEGQAPRIVSWGS
jgi:UDP-2,3-diacylglucosamine hydrolase